MGTQPTVGEFMTAAPAVVDENLSLADAQDRMYANNIRHLCVMRDNRVLVGVVSQRDLAVAMAVGNGSPKKLTVAAAMSPEPYTVTADTPLLEVAETMEANRYGCAVVMNGYKIEGVFTTTDALRALREFIAGAKAAPLSRPTHIVEKGERQKVKRARMREVVGGPSANDGRIRPFEG